MIASASPPRAARPSAKALNVAAFRSCTGEQQAARVRVAEPGKEALSLARAAPVRADPACLGISPHRRAPRRHGSPVPARPGGRTYPAVWRHRAHWHLPTGICVYDAMTKVSGVSVNPAPARADVASTCVVFSPSWQATRSTLASMTAWHWKKVQGLPTTRRAAGGRVGDAARRAGQPLGRVLDREHHDAARSLPKVGVDRAPWRGELEG